MRRRHIRSGRFSWLALILFALMFSTGVSAQQTPPPPTPPKPEIEFAITNDGRRIRIPDVIGTMSPVLRNGVWVWETPSSPGKGQPLKSSDRTKPSDPVEAQPQVVIGADNRVRACCTNTFPYSAVVHFSNNLKSGCTGAFYNNNVGRSYIVTAGHCIYDGGQWAGTSVITPGQNGALPGGAPFGTCGVGSYAVPDRWWGILDGAFDIGVILIPPGGCFVNYTGAFGLQMTDVSINNTPTWMLGYHGDKDNGQTQWYDNAPVTNYIETQFGGGQVEHSHDMTPTASSAPLWDGSFSSNPRIIAVNVRERPPSGPNYATPLTPSIFNFLLSPQ